MNRLKPSNKLLFWAGGAVLATSVFFGWVIPSTKSHAQKLATQAEQYRSSNPAQALAGYKMAAFLDPSQPDYNYRMADIYLAQNQPGKAMRALDQAGTPNAQLKAIEIELRSSRFQAAQKRIEKAIKLERTPGLYILQAKASLEAGDSANALASAKAAGNKAASIESFAQRVHSKQQGATALALARDLYGNGMPVSANRILDETAPESTLWYALKADILLTQQKVTKENLLAAKDYLKAAIKMAPYDISLHRQIKSVFDRLGDKQQSQAEEELIRQLVSQK
ncbi:MAG TPA: hypothetical protein VNA68_00125 [Candidatus Dormibacteraeota bacterium]|nr:hypothetical protein [Candidatus Dormibacteraeota bacterium]